MPRAGYAALALTLEYPVENLGNDEGFCLAQRSGLARACFIITLGGLHRWMRDISTGW